MAHTVHRSIHRRSGASRSWEPLGGASLSHGGGRPQPQAFAGVRPTTWHDGRARNHALAQREFLDTRHPTHPSPGHRQGRHGLATTLVTCIVAVTGASSGIGAAFARALASRGHSLLLVARRRQRLEDLAEDLEGRFGCGIEVLVADLTVERDLSRVEERLKGFSGLEGLVNNAGFGTKERFHEAPLEGQVAMHRLHVMATMRLTRAVLPGMITRRKGYVVNVSSLGAFTPIPGNVSYCATKAWINSFTEGLALELRAIGSPVRVRALCPGFTLTEFHDVMGFDRSTVPDRWWMRAEDVVDASLEGLEKGRLFVVPGRRKRSVAALLARNAETMAPRPDVAASQTPRESLNASGRLNASAWESLSRR